MCFSVQLRGERKAGWIQEVEGVPLWIKPEALPEVKFTGTSLKFGGAYF